MSVSCGELSARAVAMILFTSVAGRDASLETNARPRPRDAPVTRYEAILWGSGELVFLALVKDLGFDDVFDWMKGWDRELQDRDMGIRGILCPFKPMICWSP